MTTTRKVLTVAAIALAAYFYLPIVIPLAVIPFACMVLKMATFPWFWEKARVIGQIQDARVTIQANEKATQEKVNEFFAAKNSSNWNAVIQIYMQNACLSQYRNINNDFYVAIDRCIGQNAPWDQLQRPLSRLNPSDANMLIDLAISKRLDVELQHQTSAPIISAAEILEFIRLSLPRSDLQAIQNCYEYLLSNSLKVNPDNKTTLNLFRLHIADLMITHLTQIRIANAANQVEQGIIRIEEINKYRPLVVSADSRTLGFYKIFIKPEEMQKVHSHFANIHTLNQLQEALKSYDLQ
jgi:hypothetical protein